ERSGGEKSRTTLVRSCGCLRPILGISIFVEISQRGRYITSMARKSSNNLTERELEIMQVLWSLGEARLGEIQDALNRSGDCVAPSTVATQLQLLVHEG